MPTAHDPDDVPAPRPGPGDIRPVGGRHAFTGPAPGWSYPAPRPVPVDAGARPRGLPPTVVPLLPPDRARTPRLLAGVVLLLGVFFLVNAALTPFLAPGASPDEAGTWMTVAIAALVGLVLVGLASTLLIGLHRSRHERLVIDDAGFRREGGPLACTVRWDELTDVGILENSRVHRDVRNPTPRYLRTVRDTVLVCAFRAPRAHDRVLRPVRAMAPFTHGMRYPDPGTFRAGEGSTPLIAQALAVRVPDLYRGVVVARPDQMLPPR